MYALITITKENFTLFCLGGKRKINVLVEERYLKDEDRLKAIEEYNNWVATDAKQMIMKLKEVRGRI